MPQEYIEIHGARENNLKNITLRIPKRKIIILTGVSGSGKSSIVFEHHLHIIKQADWIIDMGPEGGSQGGQVIFEGTPKQLLSAKHSLPSQYVRQ